MIALHSPEFVGVTILGIMFVLRGWPNVFERFSRRFTSIAAAIAHTIR